jgi:DNA invertase Pin-like site-specific DNA recombinase
VIIDQVSGTVAQRLGLEKVKELHLDAQGVGLQSLHESIDTTTPTGRLTFYLFGALAEFERNLI